MLSHGVLILFRLVHILTGIFWVGSMLFMARFLFPAARALGPAAGPVMDHLTRVRKLPQFLMGLAFLTVLSGLGLYWHDSMGFAGVWMRTPTGMTFGTGGLLAIIAVVIGLTVNAPTAKRLGELMAQVHGQGGPPTPAQAAEMNRLQTRIGIALQVVALLTVLATLAMAVARYMT